MNRSKFFQLTFLVVGGLSSVFTYQNCGKQFEPEMKYSGPLSESHSDTPPQNDGENPLISLNSQSIQRTPWGEIESSISLKDSDTSNIELGSVVKYVQWNSVTKTNDPGPLQNDDQYKNILRKNFNFFVPGNEFKTSGLQYNRGSFTFDKVDNIAQIAISNGQKLYGHTLLWHLYNPPWVNDLNSSEETKKAITDHIKGVLEYFNRNYPTLVTGWDVVNEALSSDGSIRQPNENPWAKMNQSSNDPYEYIDFAFRTARASQANVDLFYNDYGIIGFNNKSDGLYRMIENLKARGTPIDGVGFQTHLRVDGNSTTAPSYQQIKENLQRFAQLGLKIRISELDVRIKLNDGITQEERDLQADVYYRVVAACVEVPACKTINFWGFTDKYSWIPKHFPGNGTAHLWSSNYEEKQTLSAVKAALQYGEQGINQKFLAGDTFSVDKLPALESSLLYNIKNNYDNHSGFKAIALAANGKGASWGGPGFNSQEDVNKVMLERCQLVSNNLPCAIFAEGDTVKYDEVNFITNMKRHIQETSIFNENLLPGITENSKKAFAGGYYKTSSRNYRALAIGWVGNAQPGFSDVSQSEANRRALESCEITSFQPCTVYAQGNQVVFDFNNYKWSPKLVHFGPRRFDPQLVPFVRDSDRNNQMKQTVSDVNSGKYVVLALSRYGHFWRKVQSKPISSDDKKYAKAKCNQSSGSSTRYQCFIYSVNLDVVFTKSDLSVSRQPGDTELPVIVPDYGDKDKVRFIEIVYERYFNRAPDQGGLSYYKGLLTSKKKEVDVEEQIIKNAQGPDKARMAGFNIAKVQEFFTSHGKTIPNWLSPSGDKKRRDYLEMVYQKYFDRSPDQEGANYWTGEMTLRAWHYIQRDVIYSCQSSDRNYILAHKKQLTINFLNHNNFNVPSWLK